jgi:type IV secretion system protein VirD4
MERILTPPDPAANPATAPSSDDWSSRIVSAAKPTVAPAPGASEGDPANAGIRREPELPEHEEIVASPRPPEQEFDLLDDEPDIDAAKARALRSHIRLVARQASLDPGDGIEL